MVVGIETRVILVKSNEVEVYRSTLYISRLATPYCQDTGVLLYHLLRKIDEH